MSPKTKRNISKGTGQKFSFARPVLPPGAPVVFIHPAKQGLRFRSDGNFGRPYGLIPVGLPAIVNLLRQNGYAVRGVNHSLELQLNSNFNLRNWLVAQRDVRVCLIDMHWYEHCYGAIEVARLCKQVHPQAWTVLGGLSATGFAREIMDTFPEVDCIVRGDGEIPTLELVRNLCDLEDPAGNWSRLGEVPNISYRTPGGVIENDLSYTGATIDLDRLDYVDLSFLEHEREYSVHEYIVTDLEKAHQALETSPFRGRWLTTARGCKYECAYCGGGKSAHKILANRKGLVVRSPEKVVDELAQLQQAGIVQASLAYDIAELGEDYWQVLFADMRRRNVDIGIYNEFFQMPSFEFVEDLAKTANLSHSCVALSPLSGNERVRRLNGKHFSNDQLFEMLDLLSQKNFYLFVYFSINLPGETDEAFSETLELARQVFYFYPNRLLKILNSVHTIDPLAPMNMRPERYGIQASMSSFMDFYNYCKNTQETNPDSRIGLQRGFELEEPALRNLSRNADLWDLERQGKEISWWPIPPSW